MSEADEMFDEICYEKIHDNKRRVVYKRNFARIEFNNTLQQIFVDNIDMKELKAINKKVEELGWNE